jgi:hypothetical protein
MKRVCVHSRAQRVSPIPVRDVEVLLYLKSRAERGTSIAKKALEVQS